MEIKQKYILLFLIIFSVILLLFGKISHENMSSNDNITVVSGYWKINSKFKPETYDNWFKNTLNINQRYIFFCDEKDVDYIKSFRNNYETEFIIHPLDNFYSLQYARDNWIDKIHSPSKEISMIWHEKINMMKMAKDYDIAQYGNTTEFYIWADSGFALYRDKSPPSTRLNMKDINSLPHKFCYSQMGSRGLNAIAGTCIIIHRDIIDIVHELYYQFLNECNKLHTSDSYCGADQQIFTEIKDKYPDLFYRMSDGWGGNLEDLYNNYV